jgi:hypothetical protein
MLKLLLWIVLVSEEEEEGWTVMMGASRLVSTASGFTFPSFLAACILRVFLVRLDFLADIVFLPSLSFPSGPSESYRQIGDQMSRRKERGDVL